MQTRKIIFSLLAFISSGILANPNPNPASSNTQQINAAILKQLPFANKDEFIAAEKGFIGKPSSLRITLPNGTIVWNMDAYSQFQALDKPAPSTVNPALWRQAQLNSLYGLFKVKDHIYQVRGYDISVMTIIEGKTGYIVVDPLSSKETAEAAMQLVYQQLGKKPVVSVIYTHSHIDHFGGVRGIISKDEVQAGKVSIIAPEGFLKEAVSENIYAGNAMGRRAMYMYGSLLPINATGQVDSGIGKQPSDGSYTLIAPTVQIGKTGQKMTIDGVDFIFQYTPNTEAPAEMNFYLPQYHALCIAENAVASMHNLYTLRGAKVRNAAEWFKDLNQTISLFGQQTQVLFGSHNWPVWGQQNVVSYLENQRDVYKFIHDQTLHLANQGYTMNEIAEKLKLPPALNQLWYAQGYYGSVSQNAKAVYQMYLGWYDGNPANLNPYPPVETAIKTVEYMGGADAVLKKAQQDYNKGDYRFVAQVVNNVVMADPNNKAARQLLADAYEQMGYQSENATWRNIYLSGALELREEKEPANQLNQVSPDFIAEMTPDMLFDYMAIRLNAQKAADKKIAINIVFDDLKTNYVLSLDNEVLNTLTGPAPETVDTTIETTRATLNKILLGQISLADAVKQGQLKITGNPAKAKELLSLLDNFDPMFNIVTP